jgi:hypothetical protein
MALRIIVAFNSPTLISSSSIRYELYIKGLRSQGHDATLLTTKYSASGFTHAGEIVSDASAFVDPAFWRARRPDILILPTWMGMADVLGAVRPYCGRIVALTDSDGCIGARVHPLPVLLRMLSFHQRWADQLRSAAWFVRQYLWAYRPLDDSVIQSCQLSDRLVVCSPGARDNLRAFFAYYHRPELTDRVSVVPYPVDESFESNSLLQPLEREDRIVAIGRWSDPQKDGSLLANALMRALKARPATRCAIVGAGGDNLFAGLTEFFPDRVEILGRQPQERVMGLLRSSRCLLSTSRWESGPIVASEAMLCGSTLVGPESIPSFSQFCRDGDCGTLFSRRSGSAVGQALITELLAWDKGRRDPEAIASRWRGQFAAPAVCQKLLAGL